MSMTATFLGYFSVYPFNEETLHRLGYVENWDGLRRIIGPIARANFAVADGFSQALVDEARRRFDIATGDSPARSVLQRIARTMAADVGEIAELLLSIGVDPDLPAQDGWRPSHSCVYFGNLKAAQAIFLCRPDMRAENPNGNTPLLAAREVYKNDQQSPERPALRKEVARYIESGCFETVFPTIGELALKKHWFAVKNLARRQAVPRSEFESPYCGKTAVEWAEYHGEDDMAAELRYYVALPAARALDLETETEKLRKELDQEREKASRLELQCTEQDKKIDELMETLTAVTAQLKKGAEATQERVSPSKKRKFDKEDP